MAPNKYTITVKNLNGSDQNYSLFNQKPIINGKVQEQIFSNVFCNISVPTDQTADVTISTQYKAVVGTHKGDDESVKVKVGMTRDITLGVTNNDGTVTNGTTLEFTRATNGAPTFSADPLPSTGFTGAFAIKTPSNKGWTKDDARDGKEASPPLPSRPTISERP